MSVLKEFIQLSPDLKVQDYDFSRNRLIDPVWYFQRLHENVNQLENEDIELNFYEVFGELPPEKEVFVKQVLTPANQCLSNKHYQKKDGTILISDKTLSHTLQLLKVIVRELIKLDTNLKDLDSENLHSFWKSLLSVGINRRQKYSGLRSFNGTGKLYNLLKSIQNSYLTGQLIDGFKPLLSYSYACKKSIIELGSESFSDFDYAEWKKGGDFSGLPVHKSMALLMTCMQFLRSDKVKVAIAFLRFRTRIDAYNSAWLTDVLSGKMLSIGTATNGMARPQNTHAVKEELQAVFANLRMPEIEETISQVTFKRINKSKTEISLILEAIPTISLIVIAIITGARRNELESIQWGDIYRDEDATWRFKSNINKTNNGLSTVRYISGIAAEIVDGLKLLHEYANPELKGSLFNTVKQNGKLGANAGSSDSSKKYFDRINSCINPLLSDDLKFKEFNIHSCRHAWAEFALRRFEGESVPELIRQHFRHHFGSYMTKEYIQGKLNEEDGIDLEKAYIKELIGRMAEGQERFYGPVADFILEQVSDFEFVCEDEIEELSERFKGHIEPHEYGYCVVRPETVSTAQCYNNETQMAETTEARWEKCGGCVNRLTMPSHRDDIMRICQSIYASIQSFEKVGLIKLVDVYKPALKRGQQALMEIDTGEKCHV